MNIWSEEEYPQYLVYEGEGENINDRIYAMEDGNTGTELVEPSLTEAVVNFFVSFFKLMVSIFNK